jgi:hypothetical protein
MTDSNTWLEDIAADIGYSATAKLVGWYGGGNLSVPTTANVDSTIHKLIGERAFAVLVREYGGQIIPIPNDALRDDVRRDRIICEMLLKGLSLRDISQFCGMGTRNVLHIKARLEQSGLLPMILKG